MNEEEKKVYAVLLKRVSEQSNSTNSSFSIKILKEFVEVVELRIKAEKGKGAWC
jgi:hypothetical protein